MTKKSNNRMWPRTTDGWGVISTQNFGTNTGWNSGWNDNMSIDRRAAFKNTFTSRPPPMQNVTPTYKKNVKTEVKDTCNIL